MERISKMALLMLLSQYNNGGVEAWGSTSTSSTRVGSTRATTTTTQLFDASEKSKAEEWWDNEQKLESTLPDSPIFENSADEEPMNDPSSNKKRPKYVVVGGGWGGWGAAKAFCQNTNGNAEVILLDALPDPTGNTPYLSKTGKPVEAGTRGFWKDYPNINALCAELNLAEDDVFTPFTNSSFYSLDGLEATAPVFSNTNVKLPFFGDIPSQLPSPLGQVLATFPLFERIPLSDRASMIGLLIATIDCLGNADNDEVAAAYDRMTAHDLFIRFGLSDRLVEDFIKPTLLVGLFKPPEELSALVVMELLYYYALAHQDSFDVRWIKNGTVSDSLVAPLANMLQEDYNLTVLGGCRVSEISLNAQNDQATKLTYSTMSGDECEIDDIDGIVLALGAKGMEGVIKSSPDLARIPTFSAAASLKGIDVISCRIWFDRVVPTRTPANVFSRFEALRGAGGTFFMLDQLQENNPALWGDDDDNEDNTTTKGSVVACDFYNAGALLSMSDADIIATLTEELLPSAVAQFADAKVLDSWVGKYPGTVSWFAPGSYHKRPPLSSPIANIKCAGDWVRMGDLEHGAKGLCQERAYVSGLQAANLLTDFTSRQHDVIDVRGDEEQFKLGVQLNKQVMGSGLLPRFWVR